VAAIHITREAFEELLLAWFWNASRVLRPGHSFHVWGGDANLGLPTRSRRGT
jgi:hypothetical protein